MSDSATAQQIYEMLCQKIQEEGGKEEDVKCLLEGAGAHGRDQLVRYLVKVGKVYRNRHYVSIRHASFEEAVAATDCDTESRITAKDFEIKEGEIVINTDIILFNIGDWYRWDGGELEVGAFLSDSYVQYVHRILALRPATILELLALAECYADLGVADWIYARGSYCFTSRGVAAPYLMVNKRRLKGSGTRRLVGTGEYSNPYDGSGWMPDTWFAGVPL